MAFCNKCGADLSAVKFCPESGKSIDDCEHASGRPGEAAGAAEPDAAAPASHAPQSSAPPAAANDNVMGALAYVTIIPAIVFLLIEPYNKNRFIRFHSLQCLFFAGSMFVLSIVNMFLGFIPIIGLLTILTSMLIFLGGFAIWIFVVIKAYNGEEYRLPIIGDMAAQKV